MNVLTIQNLSKSFGKQKIIDGLSMSVPEGSVFGFIGKNGAGKTTTMKMVLGLLQPDSGSIFVCNEPVRFGQTKTNQYIGYLPDVPEFYNYMTPLNYLTLCGEVIGLSKTEITQRGQELLTLVGLDGVTKQIGGFSRGMKQRLMFARAILHQPKLLFLDEPTANLDPATSADVHALIREMNRQGTTIFLTTHNMEEAQELCDRVAFLNEGHLVEEGTPQALRLKYAEDSVELCYQDGTTLRVRKEPEAIREALKHEGRLLTIHSQEPDLKTIFLQLTGRDLR